MTDKPSNYELDDELLSAYLDGELSADERAAVEARLATDPAAQQLLHELRSVSQSVQALPTETLGRDLSDEIVRRVRVVRGSPDPAPSRDRRSPFTPSSETSPGNTLPKIRVFGSRRAWIWASMALAAGLLIMIVQSGDESAKKLPPIAARNQEGAQIQPTDEAAKPASHELSISAPKSPSTPLTTIVSDRDLQEKQVDTLGGATPAAPMASEPRGVQLGSTNRVGAAPDPPVTSATAAPKARKEVETTVTELDDASSALTALPEQVATDKSAAAPRPTGSLGGGSGGLGMSAGRQKSESVVIPTTQRFFVVHVVATPDALKKGSFDRLLADNKIEFVPQPAKKQPFSGGGTLAKPAESATRSMERSNKAAEIHASKTELILVEAPAPAIESCLADLNKNANDFVSIAVNEGRQSQDRFDAKSTVAKTLAETPQNLNRFSRGAAPEAQKDKGQKDSVDLHYFHYDFDKPNDLAVDGLSRAGGEAGKIAGATTDANGDKKWYYKDQPAPDIRRARSIASWGIDNRQSGDVAEASGRASRIQPQSIQSGAEASNQPMSQRKPNEQTEAKSDNQSNNLKVLFVFTSEETPAPSAPSDNRPK